MKKIKGILFYSTFNQDILISDNHNLTAKKIIREGVKHFKVPLQNLKSGSTKRVDSYPRQIIIYLLCTETKLSLWYIGYLLGNRHHTTIMHSRDKIREQKNKDDDVSYDIKKIMSNVIV